MTHQRVFVIDGDPAVRDSLKTLMNLNGLEVATYATGQSFLRARERDTQEHSSSDYVICESELPDTSGIEVFEALMARQDQVHFALLMSRKNERTALRARQLGIAHVFSKPLVHRNLLAFVASR
ncbi:MAG: response regulator [Pseudomonadales bacterium]